MQVVAFVGPKGSGKDTCADIMKKQKKVRRTVSFAMPMKRICSEVFDLHMNFLSDPVLKEKELKEPIKVTKKHLRALKTLMSDYVDPYNEENPFSYNYNRVSDKLINMVFKTPRRLLQIIGTEFIRNEFHPDWHCMAAFSEKNLNIVLQGQLNANVAVADCRFPNEFAYLMNKFGNNAKFFYIERPEAEAELAKATHASETEILKVKELIMEYDGQVIENTGTIEDLTNFLKEVKIPKSASKASSKPEPGSRFRFGPRQ